MEAELDFVNKVNLEKNLIEEDVCKSVQFLDNKLKDSSNELIADQDVFIHNFVQNSEIEATRILEGVNEVGNAELASVAGITEVQNSQVELARILDGDKEVVNAESASATGITEVQNSNFEFIAAQIQVIEEDAVAANSGSEPYVDIPSAYNVEFGVTEVPLDGAGENVTEFVTLPSEVNLNFKKAVLAKGITSSIDYSSASKHKLFKELQTLGPAEDYPRRRKANLSLKIKKRGFCPFAL
ncbi:uncharacterized protein LOC114579982 [Dendrobium catenatum]|uniref:uncharacterized protein LOC114579982 n=1 Tax=Dendrobium catenatum TaxID=906689 RepID=UPI0010A00640|nr:uncharacterized protein LOC114579982 [Dendrobium catenatum]